MKKLLSILLIIAVSFGVSCFAKSAQPANDKIGIVKVCGQAMLLGGEDVAKDNALKNAKFRAVSKATARFVTPTQGKDSMYQRIVGNYDRYVSGKIKIVKKQKVNGKFLLFCDVPVDFGLIDSDIKNTISSKQNEEQNELDEAVFLVRVVGLDDAELTKKIPFKVLLDYAHAFKELGFNAQGGDLSGNALHSMLAAVDSVGKNIPTYEEYRQVMLKSLREDMVDVTLAVLGEIRVAKVDNTGTGAFTAVVECLVESIGLNGNNVIVIGKHQEPFYSPPSSNRQAAIELAFQKATINSAKNLANMTLEYWKNNHK